MIVGKEWMRKVILISMLVVFQTLIVECAVSTKYNTKIPNSKMGPKASESLTQLANEFQTMGVEGLGQSDPEYWESTVNVIKEFPELIRISLRSVPHSLKSVLANRWAKDRREFNQRARDTFTLAKDVVAGAKNVVKEFSDMVYGRIDEFEKNTLLPDHTAKWEETKGRIVKTIEDAKNQIHEEVEDYHNQFQDFMDGVQERVNQHHHHPILHCGKCNAEFTMRQFLKLVEDRGYFIKEEDWWNDEEIEEFYSGWGYWANRSAVHCPHCGVVNWKDATFVGDAEEEAIESHSHDNYDSVPEVKTATTTTSSTSTKTTDTKQAAGEIESDKKHDEL